MSFHAKAIKRNVGDTAMWFLEIQHPARFELIIPENEEFRYTFANGIRLGYRPSRFNWDPSTVQVDVIDLKLRASDVTGDPDDPILMPVLYAMPDGTDPEEDDTVEITRSGGGGPIPLKGGKGVFKSSRVLKKKTTGKRVPVGSGKRCLCGLLLAQK